MALEVAGSDCRQLARTLRVAGRVRPGAELAAERLVLFLRDLRFVSVAKVSGSGPWTPVNTGTDTQLVIEDPTLGIDAQVRIVDGDTILVQARPG